VASDEAAEGDSMTPFVRWIFRQAKRADNNDRDDIVADFCCDARRDPNFPRTATITAIRKYMERYPYYAQTAFEDARVEYRDHNRARARGDDR